MKLLLSQPFYGSLCTAVSLRENSAVPKMEMSLFPAPVLSYNREWFESLRDAQALGALLHELLHMLLLHALRRGERDALLWPVCCDMAVNDYLLPEMLPPDAVTTEKIAEKTHRKLERFKSAETYYGELVKLLDDSLSLLRCDGRAVTLPFSNDSPLTCEMLKEEESTQMNVQAHSIRMQELIDRAAGSGEIAPELMGELTAVYQRAKVDWRAVFRRFLNHRGRIERRSTYKRESRRYEGFPGNKRSLGLRVLVALDESGSISDEQLLTFLRELAEVNHHTKAQLLVTEFDTDCTEPKPPAVFRHTRKRNKKGGTDFRCVFALADELQISFVLVFTDGQGIAPVEVNQRVLWVLINGGSKPGAYGDTVSFE